jgi:hypothetical protein
MLLAGPAARIPAETPKAVNTRQRARRWSLGEQSSTAGPALSHLQQREGPRWKSLTDTLMERVDQLVHASKAPREWGSPRLSVTPTSVAIRQLAAELEALENALRGIALEVHKLSAGD